MKWFSRRRDPAVAPEVPRYVARAMHEGGGRFAAVKESHVLIYWPHGLGDWAHLSTILPLLEPSNRYFITRFGDDFTALMEGNLFASPLYCGTNALSDGAPLGATHLGLNFRTLRGAFRELAIPEPLHAAVVREHIDVVLYSDYPEPEGRAHFPFHTKARALARKLITPERLAQTDLTKPLPTSISFSVASALQQQIDDRLALSSGERLCILAPSGHTNAAKTWGANETARFKTALRKDDRWRVFDLDVDYGQHFGMLPLPFATVYKALLARAALFVGVPAGPLHLASARSNIAIVGIWQAHHPDWYDEPNPLARHVVGSHVPKRRPATTTRPAAFAHHITYVPRPAISADDVLAAVRELINES